MYRSINYKQQRQIDAILQKLNDLQTAQRQCCTASSIATTQQVVINSADGAALFQNIPNPFNHTTTINYTLPQKYSSAKIMVVDKSGKILKEINVSGSGKGSLRIDASTLASGAYNYSLYVEGKLIDTKQMILVK